MAKVALDLSQFKSAGVYTVEVDQSERIQVTTQSLRLVPGFSSQGPFNAPVFIRSGRDLTKFYGPIDQKLERKGSFFQRSINTCLLASPVFALNLIKVNTDPTIDASVSRDHVDYIALYPRLISLLGWILNALILILLLSLSMVYQIRNHKSKILPV